MLVNLRFLFCCCLVFCGLLGYGFWFDCYVCVCGFVV